MTAPLPRAFFARPPELVAVDLLGCTLIVRLGGTDLGGTDLGGTELGGTVALRITETEAYGGVGDDAASHAHRGFRPRSATMFGPPGRLYVYFTYGMHHCANVVAHPDSDTLAGAPGVAGAVLLRAAAVTEGLDLVRRRRLHAAHLAERDLARGPARLTVAAGLALTHDGLDLCGTEGSQRDAPFTQIFARAATLPAFLVRRGPRVGISRDIERPWRFWIAGDPTVSGSRASNGGASEPGTAPQSPT